MWINFAVEHKRKTDTYPSQTISGSSRQKSPRPISHVQLPRFARPVVLINSLIAPAIAFIMGVAMAFYIFPADMLLDRWEYWETSRGDMADNLIGYLYLAMDEWRWPLTWTTLLNPPSGVNAFYTDLIPGAALLGKIIYKVTGTLPLFLGRWLLLSYGMQAFIGWLIFRQIGLRPFFALVPAALVVMTPAFLFRFGHLPLTAHWVILAAILFYLRAVSGSTRTEKSIVAIAIGSILTVNPYLLVMSAVVFLVGVAEAARRKRIPWREFIGIGALMVVIVGVWALVFGIVGQSGDLPAAGGFGHFSMNLLSPIIPQLSYSMNLLSPITPQLSSSITGLEGILDHTGGQYEGFNYLGGGVLALIIVVLVSRSGALTTIISAHPVLAILLIGLTFYAASDKLYLGHFYIADLRYAEFPILHTLASVFRSSGRFFWPVAYFAVVVVIAVVAGTFAPRSAFLLITVATLIQWGDIHPLIESVRKVSLSKPDLVNRASFTKAAASYDEFTIHPSYHCASESDRDKILQLQLIAARTGIPVNAAYINRGAPECSGAQDRFAENIVAESATSNPLIIIFNRELVAQLSSTHATAGFSCRVTPSSIVCSRRANDPAFVALGREFKAELPSLPIDTELSLGKGGDGAPFLGAGWSFAEAEWHWAQGQNTYIIGRLSRPVCSTLSFSALLWPLSRAQYVVDRGKVTLNGDYAGEIRITERMPHIVQYSIPLGDHCLQDIRIGLHFSNLESPQQLQINQDSRKLSWAFRWFSIGGK